MITRRIGLLTFFTLAFAAHATSRPNSSNHPANSDHSNGPEFGHLERTVGVSMDPSLHAGQPEAKIHTDVSVVRVHPEKAKDVDSAVRWLRKELAVNEGTADVHKQIFVVGPGHDQYFLSPHAAESIGNQLGWDSAQAHIYNGLEEAPAEFTEAIRAAKQLESGSVIFQGVVTRESLARRARASAQLPRRASDWAFILFRVAVNGTVVAKVAMLTPGVSLVQAAEIGATAGFMSGALQAFHPYVMKWFGQRGYLRPSNFKPANFIESFYIKDFMSECVFLSVIEAVEVINHMHGQLSTTPLTLALKTPLAEGTALATLAKATQLYGERARRGQLTLPAGSAEFLARLSAGPFGKVVNPTFRLLDKAAGGPVLQTYVDKNKVVLTEDAVNLLSKMGGVGLSALLTGITVLGINHFAGTDMMLMGIGATGALAYAGISGVKPSQAAPKVRQIGLQTANRMNACIMRLGGFLGRR